MKEYLWEFPRDILILYIANNLLFYGCSGGGSKSYPAAQLALCTEVAPHYGDDWAFQSRYSFAHHESGILDEALRLAEASLKTRPGQRRRLPLRRSRPLRKRRLPGRSSVPGRMDQRLRPPSSLLRPPGLALLPLRALPRPLQKGLGPLQQPYSTRRRRWGWWGSRRRRSPRLENDALFGHGTPDRLEVLCSLAEPSISTEGTAYRDVHAALAFAGANDWEKMTTLLDRFQDRAASGDTLASEIMVPLMKGLQLFAHERPQESLELLEPLFGPAVMDQLARVGGSHAQREVLEDTLVACFLETEQFDKAKSMLRTRLSRRPSPRDLFWLARAKTGLGDSDAAQRDLIQANVEWTSSNHDPDSPELARLRASVASPR